MPAIKLEALQEGMVVTKDIKNMDNMLLIPAGCALTPKHIDVLSAWGIAEIQVEACEGTEETGDILQKLAPEALAELTRNLQAIFWDPGATNPVQQEVFNWMLRRKAAETLAKPAPAPCP